MRREVGERGGVGKGGDIRVGAGGRRWGKGARAMGRGRGVI